MNKENEQIPSQTNLKQVIDDITSNTTITKKVLESVIGVVSAIGANSKLDQAIKSERKLKRFKKAMSSYCDLMNDVIATIIRPSSEGKNLSELLGYVNELEEDETNPKLKRRVEKYTVVEAAMQIPKIITGSIDVLQKIVDFKSGFFTFFKIKRNIKHLGYVMRETFTMMIDIFKNLASKEEIEQLVGSLVKQPDVVTEYMDSTHEQTGEYNVKDVANTTKINKQGKLGLLDVFTQTFNIIGTLTNLKTPNLIMVEFRLLKVRYVLRRILNHLIKFGDKNVNESTHTSIQNIAELIAGDGNEGKKIGLSGLFKKMAMMPLFIEKADIPAKNRRRFKRTMKFLNKVIDSIKTLLESPAIKDIDDKDKLKKLEAIKNITNELLEITISLRRLGFVGIGARILRPAILGVLNSIDLIVDKVDKLFKNKEVSEEAVKNIDSIKEIISSLIGISGKIILLGLIAVPAIVCMIPVLIFMFVLSGFLWAAYGIMFLFPNKLIKEINEDISKISTIFLTLAIVGAAICLLALMTPVVMKSLLEVILFIGILLIFVIAVAGVFWLADLILSKLKGKLFGVLGIILAVTGMLLVVAIVLLLLTKIAQKIADDGGVGTITVFVLGLSGFVLAMAGLGLALGNIFVLGGLGAVATGLAAMLGVLTLLVSIAKAINSITEIDINTTKCMSSVELVLDFMTDLKAFFDEKEKEIGDEDDWEDLEDILYEVRWVTKRIFQISDILKQIQVLELKPRVVLKSVKLVFDTITQINEEVKKNKTLGDEDYWDDLEDVLDEVVGAFEEFEQITDVVGQINNLKLDKGAIKKNVGAVFDTIIQINEEVQKNKKLGDEDYWDDLEDVLDEVVEVAEHIGSITDVLNGINNLKLSKQTIKDKITDTFEFVELINDQCAKSNALKKEDVGWFEDDSKEIAAEEMGKVAAIAKGIGTIVETLNSINEVNLDDGKITTTITDIFTFLDKTLMPKIKSSTALKPEEKDWWDRLTGKKDTKETAVDELNKISAIMESIGTITEVLSSMADFDINKAVGKSSLKQVILANIDGIFEVVDEVDKKLKTNLSAETQSEETLSFQEMINNALTESRNQRNNMRKMSKVASVLTTVGTIVDALNKVGEYKFSTTKITGNIDKIFTTIDSIYTKITEGTSAQATGGDIDLVSVVEPASEALEVLGEGMTAISEPNPDTARKNIDNYIRFIDKASKIDVQKIETSTKMFEQMSNFSNSIKGDFDKLAETLGEKLLPVLEDLKEVMGVIPEKIEASSQNISASVAASNAPATRENVEAQVNRENPNMTKEEVTKVVDTRMAEKAKSDSNGVAAKLDELISLLKGYGGENVVVQTV